MRNETKDTIYGALTIGGIIVALLWPFRTPAPHNPKILWDQATHPGDSTTPYYFNILIRDDDGARLEQPLYMDVCHAGHCELEMKFPPKGKAKVYMQTCNKQGMCSEWANTDGSPDPPPLEREPPIPSKQVEADEHDDQHVDRHGQPHLLNHPEEQPQHEHRDNQTFHEPPYSAMIS